MKKIFLGFLCIILVCLLSFSKTRLFLTAMMIGEKFIFYQSCKNAQYAYPTYGMLHAYCLYIIALLGGVVVFYQIPFFVKRSYRFFCVWYPVSKYDLSVNWKLYLKCALWCLVVTFFSLEIFLRHKGWDDTYSEANGSFVYTSPFQANEHYLHPPSTLEKKLVGFVQNVFPAQKPKLYGLFGKNWPQEKPLHVKRIITIGDSFTAGVGSTNDSSYPGVLQKLVADSVQIFNAGYSGSDPVFECLLLKKHLMTYHPDVVIININKSDITDCVIRGGFERVKSEGSIEYRKPPWFEKIYGMSYVARYIIQNVFDCSYCLFFMKPHEYQKAEQKAKKDLQEAIDKTVALCELYHVLSIVSFNPGEQDLMTNTFDMQYAVDTCRQKNYSVVSVFDYLQSVGFDSLHKQACDSLFLSVDRHFTNRGYALMAQAEFEKLKVHL